MILKIIYGYDVKPENDHLLGIVKKAMNDFSYLSRPGSYMVNYLPVLRFMPSWLPGGTFKTEAKQYRKTLCEMIDIPFELVKQQVVRTVIRSPGMFLRDLPPRNKGPRSRAT